MAVTEQFSLRWNNFHSNITTSFHELLEAAEMVDVTLAVDGQYLQAHKIVLSICSPYFKQMFKLNPCKHPIVILKDVCHENMKDILEFMYMGEVNVLRENLSSFLRTAELLQVKGLTGDDSSDTSSKKDEKLECDNEEDSELLHYNHLIDQGVELPNHSTYQTPNINIPSPLPSHTQQIQSSSAPPNLNPIIKRQSKMNANQHNSKRPKSELASANQTKSNNNKPSLDQQMECLLNNTNKFDEESEYIDTSSLKLENIMKSEKMNMGVDFSESKDESRNLEFGLPGSADNATGDQGIRSDGKLSASARHTYQCEMCCKKFSRRDHLRTHEKNIHGEDAGPFVCVICSQLYKNTESLRKHIAKFHYPKIESYQKVEVKA